MILTTRRSNIDSVKVKAHGDEAFMEFDREHVMVWAQKQMEDTGLYPRRVGQRLATSQFISSVAGLPT
jgi:hypothetical protein